MDYYDRAKNIKSIEITIPRKEAIVAIKKEFGLGLAESREFYDKLIDGTFNGENYSGTDDFIRLNEYCDWCNIELEEAPLTEAEEKEENLRLEAEDWRLGLTDKEREYIKILNVQLIAVAAG